MLRFTILILLAGLPACGKSRALGPPKAVPVVVDGGMELKLMSFNLRHENPRDTGPRSWRERVIGVVRMIRNEAPDIIGVQEALHGQAADLWASLPDYEFHGVGRDDGMRGGEYTGILFRRDRFEADPADRGTFWLSDTPEVPGSKSWGNEIPRVASWLRLTDRSTQRALHVFNTHWDHRNQLSREHAARLLASRIDARTHPDEPVVLLGDFNATENNPAVVFLTGRRALLAGRPQIWRHGLADTYQCLHPMEGDRTTLHFWNGRRNGSLKVDHILVSGTARVITSAIRDHDKPLVSDHFPLTARVVFPD